MPKLPYFIAVITLTSLFLSQSIVLAAAQQRSAPAVSLTVPLHNEDIPLTLTRTHGEAITHENGVLTFAITYSSLLSYSVPLTLQASWSEAAVNGSLVELADYVSGSATPAYQNTPPIIDTVHKTITWNIPSLPANTPPQTVFFRLKTNDNYLGTSPVTFTISTTASSNGAAISPVNLIQYYTHTKASPTASSSSSSQATSSVTPTPVSTITPPAPSNPSPSLFSSIEIQTISPSSATAFITLTEPAYVTLHYGTSPTSLRKSLTIANSLTSSTITFPDLLAQTVYYFTLTAKTGERTSTSDLFTFTTAKGDATSFVDLSSVIITADNLILTSSTFQKDTVLQKLIPTAVMTIDTPFEFRFTASQSDKIRKIVATVTDANVLGSTSFTKDLAHEISTTSVEIAEIAKGIYSGRLKTSLTPGKYTLFARISDVNGTITEQSLATLTVVKPLTVIDTSSNKPIENARVLLYRKHPRTGRYTLLSEQSIPLPNPVFTTPKGVIEKNLIQGEYKIHVSAIGYTPRDVYFTISPLSDTQYPIVKLTSHGFSLFSTIQYYTEAAEDLFASFTTYLATVGISYRLFNLISLSTLCFFLILTLLSFSLRFHIPLSAFPAYFFSHLHLVRHQNVSKTLSGVVVDEQNGGFPIHDAIIYLLDRKRRRILLHTQTNKLGQFTLSLPLASAYLLLVKKRQYVTVEESISSLAPLTISMEKDPATQHRLLKATQAFCMDLLGLCFELLLFLSLALEGIFSLSFGLVVTTPYILLTLFNLILWLLFVRNQHSISPAQGVKA